MKDDYWFGTGITFPVYSREPQFKLEYLIFSCKCLPLQKTGGGGETLNRAVQE